MARSALDPIALTAPALSTSVPAQTPTADSARILPVPSAVRNGGTFHVATNTWTRHTSSVSLGADVLYDNTCNATYFRALEGDRVADEGGLPSPTTPNNPGSRTGCATSYSIDGFQIGYCTDNATASIDVSFYSAYASCTSVVGATPVGSFALTGLPGAGAGPSLCWTVTIDAAATPFVLQAVPGLPPTQGTFGFAVSSSQTTPGHGPLIARDRNTCAAWDGTSWDWNIDLNESGTGMYTADAYWVEGGPTAPGCYWFGGVIPASFSLELYGDTCAPDESVQTGFCYPNVGGTLACPCAQQPAPTAMTGCPHSLGTGARLTGQGSTLLSADSVVLTGALTPPNTSVLYFQGTQRHNAGQGRPFGDGLRCARGQVVRLGVATSSASGVSRYPSGAEPPVSVRGGVTTPGTRTYQAWYRNVAPFCTPAGFNTTNGWEISWGT